MSSIADTESTEQDSKKSTVWRLRLRVWIFAIVFDLVILACIGDLGTHWLLESWRGTSTGILGGVLGALVFVFYKIIDHDKLLLNDLGRGPAKEEHLSYLQGRVVFGASSGFILSAIIASIFPYATNACLTAAGMVGGFSCTFLPTITAAADAATSKYLTGRKQPPNE